jgi:hypothetical protein
MRFRLLVGSMARLSRFLQPATPRERAALADVQSHDVTAQRPSLPSRISSAEFSTLGAMVVVCCPHDLDPLMRAAGGMWESGARRWLINRQRTGPLIRNLRRATDPLFRHAGMSLDGEAP